MTNYFIIPTFFKSFEQNYWIGFLFTIIPSITFGTLLSMKKMNSNILKKIKNSKIMKYIMGAYFFINMLIILLIGSRILCKNYFMNTKIISFMIPILMIAFFISKLGTTGIINMISWPIIFIAPLLIYALFFNNQIRDLKELFPIDLNFKMFKVTFFMLYVILNNYTFLLLNQEVEKPFKKKFFIFGNIFMVLINSIVSVLIVTVLGKYYIADTEFFGFNVLNIESDLKYIGNFEFVYVFMITFATITSVSINIDFFRKIFNLEGNKRFYLMGVLLIMSLYFTKHMNLVIDNLRYIMMILIGLLLIFYNYILLKKDDSIENIL